MLGIGYRLLEDTGLEQAEAHHLVGCGIEVERAGGVVEGIASLDVALNLALEGLKVGVKLAQQCRGGIVAVAQQGQQEVLGTDAVAAETASLLAAIFEYVCQFLRILSVHIPIVFLIRSYSRLQR